jgi:hypothetical protein
LGFGWDAGSIPAASILRGMCDKRRHPPPFLPTSVAVRHPSAHGTLDLFGDSDSQKQASLENRNRVFNMLNKLVLKLVGYDGSYFDYAAWKPAKVPVA